MTISEVKTFTHLLQSANLPLPAIIFPSFSILIATLTAFFASVNFTRDLITNPNPGVTDSPQIFDFIVVGAGSAGGVVANRLSANGIFNVLLLEAGGDPLVLNGIPYLLASNRGHPDTDWMYYITPQVNSCLSVMDHAIPWVRGKSVGGTSNLNSMIAMRGNPNDFNNWARLTLDSQWTYDSLLPFFKKLENYDGNFAKDPHFHGFGGPVWITKQRFQPLVNDWVNAGKELGFTSTDPNALQTSGFFPLDLTISNGMRWEVYNAYIKPALERKNFKIIRHAHVTKINLDSQNRATGVEYVRNGRKFTALASKEIVVSGGAIGSPQLLMLSGIGPSDHLKSVGIQPRVHLPGVGQALKDHVGLLVGPFILNSSVSFIADRDLSIASAVEYLNQRTGPLSFTADSDGAMISTTGESSWPNVAMFFSPVGIGSDFAQGLESLWRLQPGTMQKYLNGFVGRDATYVSINLARPASLGTITLKSKDPFDAPLINPNYYGEISDVQAMIATIKLIIRIHEQTNTFQRYNATFIPNHFPGCEGFPLRTDAYYECFVRQFTVTNWHCASTCKMGHAEDPMAVLDSNLRVNFVKGLRVADASVMPEITNANLNIPAIMIGEKVSDLILRAWLR